MDKLYGSLAKISFVIIALLSLHFLPEYWIHILVAVPAAFLVDFVNHNSRKYPSLKRIQIVKEKLHRHRLKRALQKAIEKEDREKYRKKLIENALEKVKSIDESERKTGLEQVSQFGAKDTYEKLLEILENTGLNRSHEEQIVETLYNLKNINTSTRGRTSVHTPSDPT